MPISTITKVPFLSAKDLAREKDSVSRAANSKFKVFAIFIYLLVVSFGIATNSTLILFICFVLLAIFLSSHNSLPITLQSKTTSSIGIGIYCLASKLTALVISPSDISGKIITDEKAEDIGIDIATFFDTTPDFFIISSRSFAILLSDIFISFKLPPLPKISK